MGSTPPPRPGLSRFAKIMVCLWLALGLMVIIGFFLATRLPADHPYRECQRGFGWDEECRSRIARAHALGGAEENVVRDLTKDR